MKNSFIILISSMVLLGCTQVTNKAKLVDGFIDMRIIPEEVLSFTTIDNYDIAYQAKKDLSNRYHYPDTYSIGKLNEQENDYQYVVHVKGISPIEEFDYVQSILTTFESDSTFVGVLLKEEGQIKVNVYRKVNFSNELMTGFQQWKWASSPYAKTDFKTIELTNLSLFVND